MSQSQPATEKMICSVELYLFSIVHHYLLRIFQLKRAKDFWDILRKICCIEYVCCITTVSMLCLYRDCNYRIEVTWLQVHNDSILTVSRPFFFLRPYYHKKYPWAIFDLIQTAKYLNNQLFSSTEFTWGSTFLMSIWYPCKSAHFTLVFINGVYFYLNCCQFCCIL